MGQWDDELIGLLPSSVRIFASAGAGFNWADTDALGRRKIWYANGAGASDDAVSDTALWMILCVFRNFTRQIRAAIEFVCATARSEWAIAEPGRLP